MSKITVCACGGRKQHLKTERTYRKKKTVSVLWEHNASLRRTLGTQKEVVFLVQI